MISTLVFRHPLLRSVSTLLLYAAFSMALFLNILGVLVYKVGTDHWTVGSGIQFALGLSVLWGFAGFLFKATCFKRCREWELSLPISARAQWLSYYLAILLLSSLLSLGMFSVLGGISQLINGVTESEVLTLGSLAIIFLRPWALMVMMSGFIAAWNPALANPGDHPRWVRFRGYLAVGAVIILAVSVLLPVWAILAIIPLSVWHVVRKMIAIPSQLELTGADNVPFHSATENATDKSLQQYQPNSWITHKFLVLSLFKSPVSLLALVLFVIFFGMMEAGYYPMEPGNYNLRFFNFMLVVYVLFAMTGHFILNLGKIENFPISRKFVLAWLVLPMVLALSAGYGVGRILVSATLPAETPLVFNSPDCENCSATGVCVSPEYFSLAYSKEVPLIEAPWGETCVPRSEPILKGLPWTLWKQFSTDENSTPEFVAWQTNRASETIYRQKLSIDELDDPTLKSQDGGPVFPIFIGLQVLLLLIIQGLTFRWCHGLTARKSIQVRFWTIMAAMLILHLGIMSSMVSGLTSDWIITGFILGRIRVLGELGLSGHILAWGTIISFLIAGWKFALSGFNSLEALPFPDSD